MKIGGYEVAGVLGRGGMGTVYRARGASGPEVALKVLTRTSAERVARFERERRLLAELTLEDGFVPLLDGGEAPEGAFLVMPLVAGGTLRDRLQKGPLGVEKTLELGRVVAGALARAHARGIVHRDLKPENILYTADGKPLVADLGLAKHFDKDAEGARQSVSLSRPGGFRGTAGYAPPEQADDAKTVGPPSDVFALGAILHECLSGSPAFQGDSALEIFNKMAMRQYARLRRDQAPPWLAKLVERALSPQAKDRHADGAALLEALSAPGAAGSRGVPLALGALALVAALAGGALLLHGQAPAPTIAPPPPPPPPPAPVVPAWFAALAATERPPLPLPAGVQFGKNEGEYAATRDASLELVFVPGGAFAMGDDQYEGEPNRLPVHRVELSSFFIGKCEVTVGQFRLFATTVKTLPPRDAWGYFSRTPDFPVGDPRQDGSVPVPFEELRTKPAYRDSGLDWEHPYRDVPGAPAPRVDERDPVSQVTARDARAYAEWLGLALPTEAQWEYAAVWDRKAGKRVGKFAWGDELPSAESGKLANLIDLALMKLSSQNPIFPGYDDGNAYAARVGSFPKDRSPSGVYDMTGNVREICRDLFDPRFYARSPARDPCCTDGNEDDVHTLRGGSWGWHCGEDAGGTLSLASRDPDHFASNVIGFRVAIEAR